MALVKDVQMAWIELSFCSAQMEVMNELMLGPSVDLVYTYASIGFISMQWLMKLILPSPTASKKTLGIQEV